MSQTASPNPQPAVRDTLFGDLPASSWPSSGSTTDSEPWVSFIRARERVDSGAHDDAKRILHSILKSPGLESRHYLQAWHFLRALGEQPPPAEAKRLYGVVVEVGLDKGLDIVAAYSDHSARYYNYSGAAIIWEHPNESLDSAIDSLLAAGQVVVQQIGPWDKPRPHGPSSGIVRINLLVPEGLNFGEGPFANLANDPMGGPVISAAVALMQGLIAQRPQGTSS